jgi:hypothetical protein
MIIVREDGEVGSHVVHYASKALEHHIYELTREISEVLVLSPVRRK